MGRLRVQLIVLRLTRVTPMIQSTLFPNATAGSTPAPLFHDLGDLHDRLLRWTGQPPPREVWDPLTHLVYSLISSRTKDAESIATMQALRERYDAWPIGPDSWDEVRWEKLRDAPVEEIEHTLRLVTFPERKAPRLKRTLERITERTGSLSLAFLARYRTEKIRRWIEALPGAGVKASAAVVNFSSLRRAAIAIDGHHQRIAIRLGIVAGQRDPPSGGERAHAARSRRLDTRHHGRAPHAGEEAWSTDLHAARSRVPALPTD